jgi:hypothetical protein
MVIAQAFPEWPIWIWRAAFFFFVVCALVGLISSARDGFRFDPPSPSRSWVSIEEALAFVGTGRWHRVPDEVRNPIAKWRMKRAVTRIEKLARRGVLTVYGKSARVPWGQQGMGTPVRWSEGGIDAEAALSGEAKIAGDAPYGSLTVSAREIAQAFN